jgi:curved DNA-binding protein CbpA
MSDPYEVLGIAPGATHSELMSAFRTLAQIYHPDRYMEASAQVRDEASRRMKEITAAYRALEAQVPKELIYKTRGWTNSRKARVTLGLLERNVDHSWNGDYLTVAREHRSISDALVLTKEPTSAADDLYRVSYYTEGWDNQARADLTCQMLNADIAHCWDGEVLSVDEGFEEIVDQLVGY